MKAREIKHIDLDFLYAKLATVGPKKDTQLRFEVEFFVFIVISVLNVNLALFSLDLESYNFALILFNICLLSRRCLRYIYYRVTNRDPLKKHYSFKILILILIAYILTFLHAILSLCLQYSLSLIFSLTLPLLTYLYVLQQDNKNRYSEGYNDGFSCIQNAILQTLETLYCVGYLPYKFMDATALNINYSQYLNALAMLVFPCFALQLGELFRKRSVELCFHARTIGDWCKFNTSAECEEWNSERTYAKGETVSYQGSKWKALGKITTCEPGKTETFLMYWLFGNPIKSYLKLTMLSGLILCLELGCLFTMSFRLSYLIGCFSLIYSMVRNMSLASEVYKSRIN